MLKGFAHVCFIATDLEKTIGFYVNKVGCGHAFDFKRDTGERFGVYLQVGGRQFIEIFKGDVVMPAQGSFRHICLEVDDIEGTAKAMRSKGVEVSDVKMGSDNSWQAWLADPDGNVIELHEYTPKSKQTPYVG